jgi:uncharacterized membrane protein YqjE
MTTASRVLRFAALAFLAAVALLGLAAAFLYDHRRQIRSALVATYAAMRIAAELTYSAGRWCRRQVRRTTTIPAQLPTLEATREALARWVARLYPISWPV